MKPKYLVNQFKSPTKDKFCPAINGQLVITLKYKLSD